MARHLVITINHDQDVASPCEDRENEWVVHSFCTRHVSFTHPDKFFPINIGLRRKLNVGLAFVLAYFEHGLCRWSLSGEGPQCPWDSVQKAGLLIWTGKPGDIGAKSYIDRAKDARDFLETYTDWCNGECYWYTIDDGSEDVSTGSCIIGMENTFHAIAEDIEPGDTWEFQGDFKDSCRYYEHILKEKANAVQVTI